MTTRTAMTTSETKAHWTMNERKGSLKRKKPMFLVELRIVCGSDR